MPFSSENQPNKRCKGKLARKEKRGTKDKELAAARDALAVRLIISVLILSTNLKCTETNLKCTGA